MQLTGSQVKYMRYSPQITKKYGHHYGQRLHCGHIWPYGVEGIKRHDYSLFHFISISPESIVLCKQAINNNYIDYDGQFLSQFKQFLFWLS